MRRTAPLTGHLKEAGSLATRNWVKLMAALNDLSARLLHFSNTGHTLLVFDSAASRYGVDRAGEELSKWEAFQMADHLGPLECRPQLCLSPPHLEALGWSQPAVQLSGPSRPFCGLDAIPALT